MYFLVNFFSRLFLKIYKILNFISFKFEHRIYQNKEIIKSTEEYNMYSDINEKYYLDQYWNFILPHINNLRKDITIYDLGCGQGRFSFKLANYFQDSKIFSCDLSPSAIDFAKDVSSKNSFDKIIHFENENILNFINLKKINSADLIILTEVLFYYPDWQEDIDQIISRLKPGGKIIISFRSQYYNLLSAVNLNNFEKLEMILNKRQGRIFNAASSYSWNTSDEIKKLLNSKKLILEEMYAIGTLSGIEGDPNFNICNPSKLSNIDKKKLMELEIIMGKSNLDSGRYILTVSNKSDD